MIIGLDEAAAFAALHPLHRTRQGVNNQVGTHAGADFVVAEQTHAEAQLPDGGEGSLSRAPETDAAACRRKQVRPLQGRHLERRSDVDAGIAV